MAHPHQHQSNSLGVAGFVTSLVGLIMCGGLICPLGLLFSFIALFKRPRGFAVAGFILGLIGSAWIIIAVLFIVLGLGIGVAGVAAMGFGVVEVGMDSARIHEKVVEHYEANGALPSSLDILNLDRETLIDPWGEFYRYSIEPDGRRYSIETAGADGVWDTDDDFAFDQDAAQP